MKPEAWYHHSKFYGALVLYLVPGRYTMDVLKMSISSDPRA